MTRWRSPASIERIGHARPRSPAEHAGSQCDEAVVAADDCLDEPTAASSPLDSNGRNVPLDDGDQDWWAAVATQCPPEWTLTVGSVMTDAGTALAGPARTRACVRSRAHRMERPVLTSGFVVRRPVDEGKGSR
jgi:hypothetical protein